MSTCRRRSSSGFTLMELLVAVVVVGVLATLALPAYRVYVERAQLAQLLIHVDEISSVVRIEDALGEKALQQGATTGKAPPRLPNVADSTFNEPGGIKLLLILAPAGFFESGRSQYGLVADATGVSSASRIHEFAHLLPFQERDKVWISATQLAFPLVEDGAQQSSPGGSGGGQVQGGSTGSGGGTSGGGTTKPPTQPGTFWTGNAQSNAGTWTCSARASILGADGNPLGGNAGARIRVTTMFTSWDGKPGQRGWDDVMNLQAGQGSISLANLNAQASQGEVITGCRFDVVGVDYYWPTQPTVRWDGNAASIEISKP